LVERFWRLFGVRSEWLTEESPRTNTGLDGPAATALRRLNERLPGERLASRHYRPLVREAIVHRGMGGRLGKPRITLPDSLAEWAAALTQEWIDVVQQCGYDVIGDFDELAAGSDLGPWEDPDDAGPDELLEAVEQMLDLAVLEGAELLDQVDTARVERDAARGQLEAAQAEAERLVVPPAAPAGKGTQMTSADATRPEPSREHVMELDPTAAEALRRLSDLVRDRIPPEVYDDIVVDFLAGEVLASRTFPSVPDTELAAAAEALLAELGAELLVETSRRQRNRPLRGSGSNRSDPPDVTL
jgi:hypothetical protein